MALIIIALLFFGLIYLANFFAATDAEELIFDGLLFLLHGLVALLGLLVALTASVVPPDLFPPEMPFSFGVLVWPLLVAGIWGMVAAIRPLRRLLARAMPLDPESPVHALAVAFAGYFVAYSLLTLGLGGLESQLEGAQTQVTWVLIVLQGLFLVLVAFAGVGLFVRRGLRGALERLDLSAVAAPQLLRGLGLIVVFVIFQAIAGLILQLLNPEQADLLDNITSMLLEDIDTVGEWLVLALSTGISEEILFRGALQPIFGIPVTAALFAILHVQYGLTIATAVVFIIGLLLGVVRQRVNTTAAIFIHVGYNFVLGLLSLLAPVLESIEP